MINVGGMVNLQEYLDIPENSLIYCFDSHRPAHLYNLFANPQVIFIDDGQFEDLNQLKIAFETLQVR
jgi:hypothetical protein